MNEEVKKKSEFDKYDIFSLRITLLFYRGNV